MKFASRALIALAICYAVLWVITARYGKAHIEASLCEPMKQEWHTEVADRAHLSAIPWPAYYCGSRAIAPFVLDLGAGYVCGPLCGSGAGDYLIWLPGIRDYFYTRRSWGA